ncbi:MAG: hypothetical protein SPF92_06610 [Clostridia bacterium]|nr:hypothetical protein [Clostridia bacterium]
MQTAQYDNILHCRVYYRYAFIAVFALRRRYCHIAFFVLRDILYHIVRRAILAGIERECENYEGCGG